MDDFEFAAPRSLHEALALLQAPGGGAAPLAGGTDLIVQLKEGHKRPARVVDLKAIPELSSLTWLPDGGLRIGGAVSCRRLQQDPEVALRYPGLVDVCKLLGAWQIQSRASLGGNLCNASPAADSIPMLIALGAVAELATSQAKRSVACHDFCTGPGKNVLQPGELLLAVTLPASGPGSGSAYQRFIPRNEMDIAVVGVGAWLRLNATKTEIEDAQLALGAVAPTPRLVPGVKKRLRGARLESGMLQSPSLIQDLDALLQAVIAPISDKRGTAEFRRHLAKVYAARTLQAALERALRQ